MCKCKNVELGSYDNQIELEAPSHMKNRQIGSCMTIGEIICVDKCIADEVQSLWDKGITTVGCCCGHNKIYSYIKVDTPDIQKMFDLGYVQDACALASFFSRSYLSLIGGK